MKKLFDLLRWRKAKARNVSDLKEMLQEAGSSHVVSFGTLSMLESVLQLSQLQVRDVMVPRAQVTGINREDALDAIVQVISDSGHSRFPVFDESLDDVNGILLAKDVLSYRMSKEGNFSMKEIIRPATFVPESKYLDTLLREFRVAHQHIAVVVDEYGRTSGVVTIEDILEQIVGDIEDEHDVDEDVLIKEMGNHRFIVKAHIHIDEFNTYFSSHFSDAQVDTLGGLILQKLGYLPKQGETLMLDKFHCKVLLCDDRRIRLLEINK
jgi:magnesium and cobalt transporter